MVIADFYLNLRHRDLVTFNVANDRQDIEPGRAVLNCQFSRLLGLNGSRRVKQWWLCSNVNEDLLGYVWC